MVTSMGGSPGAASSDLVEEVQAQKEAEKAERPAKLIPPKHALRMQRELRFRRGSELIYTYHGLTTSQAAAMMDVAA